MFWDEWKLGNNLQDEIKDGPKEKVFLDNGFHLPFFFFVIFPVNVLLFFKEV